MSLPIPTLEPDDAFVSRLAALAAASASVSPSAPVRSGSTWRVALAAASVAGVVGGGAWVAAALSGPESPGPPTTPVVRPSDHASVVPSPRHDETGRDAPETPSGQHEPPVSSSGDAASGAPVGPDEGSGPTGAPEGQDPEHQGEDQGQEPGENPGQDQSQEPGESPDQGQGDDDGQGDEPDPGSDDGSDDGSDNGSDDEPDDEPDDESDDGSNGEDGPDLPDPAGAGD